MGTVYDYLTWRGDLTFGAAPFCEVDSLILSMFAYLDMQDIVPSPSEEGEISVWEASNAFIKRYPDPKKTKMGVLIPKDIVKMMKALCVTQRFGNLKMSGFVNIIDPQTELQFSAVTFRMADGTAIVTYRGTDDTLIGWKEDMNMCFLPVVPAQLKATEYLKAVAAKHEGKLIVTGHSKGGNLAIYAAVKSSPAVRERLLVAYSNDGPGFTREFIEGKDYLAVKGRLRTLVPQSSVVGAMLEQSPHHQIIKSVQKSERFQFNFHFSFFHFFP